MTDREWDTIRLPRTIVADQTAREALGGFTVADIGRLYRQTDDGSFWMLVDTTPTWLQVLTTTIPASQIQFTAPAVEPTHSPGLLYWYGGNLNLMTTSTGVVRQLGEEMHLLVRNATGSTIADGTAVYISGAIGNKTLIDLADKAAEETAHVVGLTTEELANNAEGYVTTYGIVHNQDTSSWVEGTELFLGDAGALTSTRPSPPDQVVTGGWVTYQHGSDGEILVNPRRRHQSTYPIGLREARPLVSSSSFADLYIWSWTDEKFPAITGQSNQTDWTVEAYRDTGQLKVFFRHDQDNQLHGDVQMPHEWAGTDVEFHLHTIPMASGTGNVYWSGAYAFVNPDAALPAAASWTAISQTQSVAPADQYVRQIVELATCTAPVSAKHSAILSFRLARLGDNPSDTYTTSKDHGTAAANLCIESYDVHYQRMLEGSMDEYDGRPILNHTRFLYEQSSGGVTYDNSGLFVQLDARSRGGNEVEFQLWDINEAAQKGSAVTTSSTSFVQLLIGPLTLADGLRDLRVRARYTGTADEPIVGRVRVLIK